MVPTPFRRPRRRASLRNVARANQIVAANELAWVRWRTSAATAPIDRWVRSRGLDPQDVQAAGWALGWAPQGWRDVVGLLERHRVPIEVGLDAGLVRRAESGRIYDGFRGRVVLPVRGLLDGRIRGFTARRVDDSDERAPKYINSPTNRAFRKGHELFGAWEARQLLRERRGQIESLVVCEGPIDVVRVDCAGRWAAVAPCGTALSRAQAEWIVALARAHDLPVVLAFDGDRAGEAAAWRAWDLLADLHTPGLRLADLPGSRDPADLDDVSLAAALSPDSGLGPTPDRDAAVGGQPSGPDRRQGLPLRHGHP